MEIKLIKYEAGQLQKVGNAIAVTNKLLALTEFQLIPYRKKNKWGFCTPDKKIVLDCVYDETEPFNNEFANVRLFWKWGLIDKNGNLNIPCIYETRINSFSEGLANVRKDGKWGFINNKSEVVIPFGYGGSSSFSEGLARVQRNGKYGFIGKDGNVIIPIIYDNVHSFNNGFSYVRIGKAWGTIDKTGKTIVPVEINSLEELDSLTHETAKSIYPKIIKSGNKYFIVDKDGEPINKTPYECIDNKEIGFSNELIDVKLNGKWGFIDKNGHQIIPCIYDEVHPFFDGLAGVLRTEYWGFIDTKGNEIVPFIYNEVGAFANGIASVAMNENNGYINREGVQYWED